MEGFGVIIINDKNPQNYAQYDSECFNSAKKIISSAIIIALGVIY